MKQKQIIKEKGQVVLMVLLASALILTLGLSASKITTTETKIDTDQELLKKAFNTAESGIDYYLVTGKTTTYSTGELDTTADLNVSKLGGESNSLSFNSVTMVGGYEYFWLVNHEADNVIGSTYYSDGSSTIEICSLNEKAESFKIDYFYLIGSDYNVERTVVSSGNDGCISNFDISNGGVRKSLLLVVTPMDSPTKIELRATPAFPIQGEQISATGKVGGVNSTVTILNRYDAFLTEGIVSSGNVISK